MNEQEEQLMYGLRPIIDIVVCNGKRYEVNTVGMGGLALLLNPALAWRNELFGIQGCAETMVWELNESNSRKDPILHCQRYHKFSSAVKGHRKAVKQLERGTTRFFNGDGNPWNK